MKTRHRIFISYRSSDIAIAMKVKQELEMHLGRDCVFIDKDIEAGDRWLEILKREVANCWVFLPIVTNNYFGPFTELNEQQNGALKQKARFEIELTEDFVRKELEWALGHEQGSLRHGEDEINADNGADHPSNTRFISGADDGEQTFDNEIDEAVGTEVRICPLKLKNFSDLPSVEMFNKQSFALIENFYNIQWREIDFNQKEVIDAPTVEDIKNVFTERLTVGSLGDPVRVGIFTIWRRVHLAFSRNLKLLAGASLALLSLSFFYGVLYFYPDSGIKARILEKETLTGLSNDSTLLTKKFLSINRSMDAINKQKQSDAPMHSPLTLTSYLISQTATVNLGAAKPDINYQELESEWESTSEPLGHIKGILSGLELSSFYKRKSAQCSNPQISCWNGMNRDTLAAKSLHTLDRIYASIENDFAEQSTREARSYTRYYCDLAAKYIDNRLDPDKALLRSSFLLEEFFKLPRKNNDQTVSCYQRQADYHMSRIDRASNNADSGILADEYIKYLQAVLEKSRVLTDTGREVSAVMALIQALAKDIDHEERHLSNRDVLSQREALIDMLEGLFIRTQNGVEIDSYRYIFYQLKAKHHVYKSEYATAIESYKNYISELAENL